MDALEEAYRLFLDLLAGVRRYLAGVGDLVATFRVGSPRRHVADGAVGVPAKSVCRNGERAMIDWPISVKIPPGRSDKADPVRSGAVRPSTSASMGRNSACHPEGQRTPCARALTALRPTTAHRRRRRAQPLRSLLQRGYQSLGPLQREGGAAAAAEAGSAPRRSRRLVQVRCQAPCSSKDPRTASAPSGNPRRAGASSPTPSGAD